MREDEWQENGDDAAPEWPAPRGRSADSGGASGPYRGQASGSAAPYRGQARYGGGFRPANDVIASGLGKFDLVQGLRPHMAKAIWPKVVGPQVAAATQTVEIRGGDVLVIRAKHSSWANELTLIKDDIIRRLNRELGGNVIRDLYIDASGLRPDAHPTEPVEPEPPAPKAHEIESAPVSPWKVLDIEKKVASIKDPSLRSRLRNNLIRMSQAAEWKRENGWFPCESCGSLALPRAEKKSPHLCDVCSVKRMRRR